MSRTNDLLADLMCSWRSTKHELIEFRRDLHMHPELAYNEHRTTRRVALRLAAAGLRPVMLPKGTGMARATSARSKCLMPNGRWWRSAPTWTRCR